MKRGEIYYADLNPVVGSEQGGVRPVLILQNNTGNKYSTTIIIATITTKPKTQMPTHIYIGKYHKPSYAQLEQIKTIDKCRILEYVGTATEEHMNEIDKALKLSVGLI